ncbi:hypothetical protein ACFTT0_07455 [Streptomyces bauhiniae]|uniref:hypothetical protein n=1 Tax=Streptomyces bauhiniae TaxID=2340725 RepID=UPI003632E106
MTPVALARDEDRARGVSRPESFKRIDYGGVANVLTALGHRRPRIVLQTTIFVTRRDAHVRIP